MGVEGWIAEDVVLKGVLADDKEKLLPPASVVLGGVVEDDGDEKADVLDSHRLGVEMEQRLRLMYGQGVACVELRDVVVVDAVFFVGGHRGLRARLGGTLQRLTEACVGCITVMLGRGSLLLGGLGCSEGGLTSEAERIKMPKRGG
jgi:hypothetical protein